MTKFSRLSTGGIVALAIFAVPVADGDWSQAKAAEMTPALKKLVAAANKEGELLVKWSGGTFGGARGAKLVTKHLAEAYGAKIKIKWTPGGAMPAIGNEIAMAYRNKQSSPTDVYIGFSRNFGVYVRKGYKMFQSAPWKSYLPNRLTDRVVEKDKYIKIQSATLGFTYNSELAPSKPERFADLLKPGFKGKVGTTPFAAGFDQLAAAEAWGPARTIEYGKKFASQVAGFMRCNEAERVASGEFVAFAPDCSGANMMRAAKRGAPLVRVISPDVPLISYFYLAVPKNAHNPNAAKLYITYMISEQGQKDIYDLTLADLHLFPGSGSRPAIVAVQKKYNFKFKDADIAWQTSANKPGNAAQQKVKKALLSSRKKR